MAYHLRKWDAYHALFHNFNPDALVRMPDYEREALYTNPAIIRSQAKIDAIFTNARAYLKLRDRGQDFSELLWKFVDFEPTINAYQALSEVPTDAERVMLIGHNPGFEMLMAHLTKTTSDSSARLFPTAALAHFIMPNDWKSLPLGSGKLANFVRPKEIQLPNCKES